MTLSASAPVAAGGAAGTAAECAAGEPPEQPVASTLPRTAQHSRQIAGSAASRAAPAGRAPGAPYSVLAPEQAEGMCQCRTRLAAIDVTGAEDHPIVQLGKTPGEGGADHTVAEDCDNRVAAGRRHGYLFSTTLRTGCVS